MPRKRRSPKNRIGSLNPAVIDVLLVGTSELDPFMEFDVTPEQAEDYWQRFGPELRAEAARRGLDVAISRGRAIHMMR